MLRVFRGFPVRSLQTLIHYICQYRNQTNIELTSDITLKMLHPRVSLMKFWIQASHEYPELSQKAVKIMLPFATSYLCECGFSALVTIKTKYRSRLEVEDELRLSLSSITPRLDKLCSNVQAQGSH